MFQAKDAAMSGKDPYERIWEIMHQVRVAMVVTHSNEDSLRARPMAARPDEDDNAIYFLTDADAPKDQEIAQDSQICLTFVDPKAERYASITGTAQVFEDASTAARVWLSCDKAFWRDANDPRIRVIRVTPEQGEYWEGGGLVASAVKMMVAAARGSRPELQHSEKIAM